jgi:hypothetical protein
MIKIIDMEKGELTGYTDRNGKPLKIGSKVKIEDGCEFEVVYLPVLERAMIDEIVPEGFCGKMFEIDDFMLDLLPLSNYETDMAEQQLTGFCLSKVITLEELISSMGLTKEEWCVIKNEYSLDYMSENDKDKIDLYFKK